MMLYLSTRGDLARKRFCDILLEGLASDGGLYVPESYPKVDLASLRNSSYAGLAKAIEQNGGRLEILSRPGGTTVRVRLPSAVRDEAIV